MSTGCTTDKSSTTLEHLIAQLVALSDFGTNCARFELPLVAETDNVSHFRRLARAYMDEGQLGSFYLKRLTFDLIDDKVFGPVFKDSLCESAALRIVSRLNDCTYFCAKLLNDDYENSEELKVARERCLAILNKFIVIGRESGDLAIALSELCHKQQPPETTDDPAQPVTDKPIQEERTTKMASLLGQCCLSESEDKHPAKSASENALALYKALIRAAALYDVVRAATTSPDFNSDVIDSMYWEIKLLLQHAVDDVASCSIEGINQPYGSITWGMKTAVSLWQVLQFEAEHLAPQNKEVDIDARIADVNKYLRIAQRECEALARMIETQYHDDVEFSSSPSIKH